MVHLFKRVPRLRSKKCIQLWFGFFIYHFTIKGFLFQLTAVPSNKIMVWLGIYFISCFTQVSYICCKVFGISTCLRSIGNFELSHALFTHSTWKWCLTSCQRWITQLWITKCPKKKLHTEHWSSIGDVVRHVVVVVQRAGRPHWELPCCQQLRRTGIMWMKKLWNTFFSDWDILLILPLIKFAEELNISDKICLFWAN